MDTVNPKLFLRGIDGRELFERYLKGDFSKISLTKQGIKAEVIKIRFSPIYGKSVLDSIYRFRDSYNQKRIIVTTDHERFALVGSSEASPNTKYCHWCRQEISGNIVGIPIRLESIDSKYIFYTTGVFDTLECAYTRLREINRGSHYSDPVYMNSEPMLRTLFDLLYPGKKLCALSDWTLLNSNGGPLTSEQYFNDTSTWRELPSVITQVGKRELMEIKTYY